MGLHLRRPAATAVGPWLAAQQDAPFTYSEVGATRDPARLVADGFERRYDVDYRRLRLGVGRELFERACAALRSWAPFDQPWLTLLGADGEPRPGAVVCVLARVGPAWWSNPCRIVYTHAEEAPVARFAWAYGTLAGHAAHGEERFSVECQPGSEEVHCDVLAFSRPGPLARLGRPVARRVQQRFGAGAVEAIRNALA